MLDQIDSVFWFRLRGSYTSHVYSALKEFE